MVMSRALNRVETLNERAGQMNAEPGKNAMSETRDALSLLFDSNFDDLRRLAFVILGDAQAAEDVAQEAFMRLATRRALVGVSSPEAYIRTIVINLCRRMLRRQATERRLYAIVGSHSNGAVQEFPSEQRLDVWRAITSLPARQRICVVLHYLEDSSIQEIAAHLQCSAGTVKSQLHKARIKMKQSLDSPEGA